MSFARRALVSAAGLLTLAGACAHVEPPTGGPEDEAAPELLVTRPDSLVVRPDWTGPVVLVFDERISERGARESVSVSPRTSPVVVEHDGDELRVRLREGWLPGVIYHINLLPPLQDLFGNVRGTAARLVFSTGPAIPDTRLSGTVRDRVTGKPEIAARIEAVRASDSLVYTAVTDSSGAWDLSRLPEGEYRLFAFRDLNRSRGLDPFEPRDSATLALSAATPLTTALSVLEPDSTAPRFAGVEVGEGRLTVTFDDFLDPAMEISPGRIQIRGERSGFVRASEATVGEPPAAERDTARRAARRPAAQDTAAADTAARRLPARELVLLLASGAELEPGEEYRLTIRGVRNLVGLVADVDTTFVVAEAAAEEERPAARDTTAAPPPDSASAPADTAAARRGVAAARPRTRTLPVR